MNRFVWNCGDYNYRVNETKKRSNVYCAHFPWFIHLLMSSIV